MEEAKTILAAASKRNGKPVEPEQMSLIQPKQATSQGGFLDIIKHPTLRLQLLIMYFNWFTTAFIMYGLALSWQNLTGGLFLNFIIGTILDFPAKTLAMILTLKVGRKYPYMFGSLTTGVMFLLTQLGTVVRIIGKFFLYINSWDVLSGWDEVTINGFIWFTIIGSFFIFLGVVGVDFKVLLV